VSVFLRLKLVGVMLPVAVKLNAVVVSLAGSVTFLVPTALVVHLVRRVGAALAAVGDSQARSKQPEVSRRPITWSWSAWTTTRARPAAAETG
jgi:hypothetical protein